MCFKKDLVSGLIIEQAFFRFFESNHEIGSSFMKLPEKEVLCTTTFVILQQQKNSEEKILLIETKTHISKRSGEKTGLSIHQQLLNSTFLFRKQHYAVVAFVLLFSYL